MYLKRVINKIKFKSNTKGSNINTLGSELVTPPIFPLSTLQPEPILIDSRDKRGKVFNFDKQQSIKKPKVSKA